MNNMLSKIRHIACAGVMAVAACIAAISAQEAVAACATTGGSEICTPVQPLAAWSYEICDDWAAYVSRQEAWCVVKGGTWGPNATCSGAGGVTEGNATGLGAAFELRIHGASCGGSGVPPQACSNYNCNCTTVTTGGVPAREYTATWYTGGSRDSLGVCNQFWGENIIVSRTRPVGCPKGWMTSGSDQCVLAPPCETCGSSSGDGSPNVGNPINVGNGSKIQRETDYVSATAEGLRFERHYYSPGFFDLQQRLGANDDYWRHTYSSKVVPVVGNAYVMAVVVRPSGVPKYFNLSGVEMQNNDGAAHRLQQLTSGSTVTGWTLTTKDSDIEQFDAQGRLTSITTRSGMVTALAYDGSGRLQTVTDTFGRALTLGYDASGRLATMTDPASRLYQYGYDANGRLSTATYPDGKTRTYVYESANHDFGLTGIVDERGLRHSTYAYDTAGRATLTERAGQDNKFTVIFSEYNNQPQANVTDPFNAQQVYVFAKVGGALKLLSHQNAALGSEIRTYDANGNIASVRDRRAPYTTTTYGYDLTRNLETTRTEASGAPLARTITTTWHPTFRLPATITEPSGVTGVSLLTELTYNTAGALTKRKLTAGAKVREWNYTVNARGQVLTVDGPRTDVTDVTTLTYYGDTDACVGCRGQVYTITNAAGHVTTFNSYDADGRATQVTDANGVVTTLAYKPRGWLESRTVGGETTTYVYDDAGNLTRVTLPDASWVGYAYDPANGLNSVEDALGNSIEYELDVYGNRVQEAVFDPQGQLRRKMERVYDQANRLERELGAAGQTTAYTYDANRNLLTASDPLYQVTTNTYDALNRLINVKDAANGNTVFTYDAKDRLQTVKDPKLSATTGYTYDGLGNLLTQVSPDTGTTTFTYDNAGNVATQTDARSVATTYTYDLLNRVTAATVTDGTVTYEYDNLTTGGSYAKGRLTKVTDPSGNTTYVYDSLGRVTSKVQTTTATPTNKTFTVGYAYSSGRPSSVTYPSGRVIGYGYNAQGQVTSITVDGSTTVLTGAAYEAFGPAKEWTWGNGQVMSRTFDLDGRVKTLTLGPSTGTYADLSQVFGYDSLNRLINANLAAGQTQSFTYDSNSNRTNATINAASTTYTYPSTSHKLTSLSGATTRSFTYDNAGNTTVTAGVTYVYDGRGRMKQAGATTYLVNGLGQRVKKASGSDTYFAYDEAGRLVGEYDGTGATIQETVWLGDLPVALIKPNTPPAFTVYYVWADHLGTPRQITDSANVSRWEWAHSDPFGNNAPNENPAGVGAFSFNLRFPGQYFDAETGKHYNYFRDYDPALGRYFQSDPLGLSAGLNTYAYVGGAPLSAIDFQGLLTCTYSLTAGTMDCEPNRPGNVGFHGAGWHSGQGVCKDNPNCSQVKDEGPTPHMTCYSIGKQQGPKPNASNRFRRNLRPFDPDFVKPRDALQIHSCGSTARDGCSKGCIVHNDSNVKALSAILSQEEGDNTICVSH